MAPLCGRMGQAPKHGHSRGAVSLEMRVLVAPGIAVLPVTHACRCLTAPGTRRSHVLDFRCGHRASGTMAAANEKEDDKPIKTLTAEDIRLLKTVRELPAIMCFHCLRTPGGRQRSPVLHHGYPGQLWGAAGLWRPLCGPHPPPPLCPPAAPLPRPPCFAPRGPLSAVRRGPLLEQDQETGGRHQGDCQEGQRGVWHQGERHRAGAPLPLGPRVRQAGAAGAPAAGERRLLLPRWRLL